MRFILLAILSVALANPVGAQPAGSGSSETPSTASDARATTISTERVSGDFGHGLKVIRGTTAPRFGTTQSHEATGKPPVRASNQYSGATTPTLYGNNPTIPPPNGTTPVAGKTP